jgi:hypothetical protein
LALLSPETTPGLVYVSGTRRFDYHLALMSKRTNKRKLRAKKKKANHGKKPNCGRG